MSIYCAGCKIFRKVNIDEFLQSKKRQVVCGICLTVIITRDEIYSDMDYYSLYDWEV